MAEKLQPGKISGELSGAGLRFGIVVSRFNSFITDRLLSAAVDALERAGAASKDVDVVHVPGAFELPLAAKKTCGYRAIRCAGCDWLRFAGRDDALRLCMFRDGARVAVGANGYRGAHYLLRADCDTLEQAIDRAGLKGGNKGI